VCAGVAEYFNVDPLLVRIAAVVLLFSGPGFFAYVLAWIFVPAEAGPARYGEPQPPIDHKDRATQIFGIVLLALGVSVIWGDWWAPARGWLFPLGLMAVGAWLLLRPDRDDEDRPPVPPAPPAPPVPPTPAWASTPSTARTAAPDAPTDDTATDPVTPSEESGDATDGGATAEGLAADAIALGEDGEAPPDATDVFEPTTETSAGGGAGSGAPPLAPWDVPPMPGGPPSEAGIEHGPHRPCTATAASWGRRCSGCSSSGRAWHGSPVSASPPGSPSGS
jgi:phage shock protein PspC (stress-responsive transcriptional regulator)